MRDWFEIFKTGTHTDSGGNVKSWTEDDLDAIAKNYNPSDYEAPIVIGHPALDAPAYGWIESLRRTGDKLLAHAKQVAPEFAELVRNGSFKKISIALTDDNKLRHVGFLGAAAPAISGLKTAEFASVPESVCYEFSESELPLFSGQLEVPVNKLRDALDRLQLLEEKLQQFVREAKKQPEQKSEEMQAVVGQFCAYAEQKTAAGYLTPAQKQIILELVQAPETEGGSLQFSHHAIPGLIRLIELLPKQISAQRFSGAQRPRVPSMSGAGEQLRKIFASQAGII